MLILTAVGPDRPGQAHAVAQILFEAGCNIEDTTMTRLSGHFAQILVVKPGGNAEIAALQARLEALERSHGLITELTPLEASVPDQSDAPRFLVSAYGAEKTGLLASLTGQLAKKNVNVTDVQSRVASRGGVYVMLLEVELPLDLSPEALQNELRAQNANLQISVREIEEDTL